VIPESVIPNEPTDDIEVRAERGQIEFGTITINHEA
jgi:hypothetical protein